MADFKLNAEIMVEAKQALREIEKVKKSIKGTTKEFSFFERVTGLSAKRITASFAAMGLVAGKLFQSILKASPSMRAAFIEMEIAAFEMSLAIGEVLAPAIDETLVPAMNALRDIVLALPPDVQLFIGMMILGTVAAVALAAAVALIGALSLPLIVVVLAVVAALALLFLAYKENEEVIQVVAGLIAEFLKPEINELKASFGELMEAVMRFWDAVKPIIGGLLLIAIVAIATVLKFVLLPAFKLLIDNITAGINFVSGLFEVLVLLFKGDVNEAIRLLMDTFINLFDDVLTATGKFLVSFLELFGPVGEFIGKIITKGIELAVGAIKFVIQAVFVVIASIINILISGINAAITGANALGANLSKITKIDLGLLDEEETPKTQVTKTTTVFQEGGRVERTGLIFAHRNEEILRPVEARAFREGKGRGGGTTNFYNTYNIGSMKSRDDIRFMMNEVERRQKRQMNRRANL